MFAYFIRMIVALCAYITFPADGQGQSKNNLEINAEVEREKKSIEDYDEDLSEDQQKDSRNGAKQTIETPSLTFSFFF